MESEKMDQVNEINFLDRFKEKLDLLKTNVLEIQTEQTSKEETLESNLSALNERLNTVVAKISTMIDNLKKKIEEGSVELEEKKSALTAEQDKSTKLTAEHESLNAQLVKLEGDQHNKMDAETEEMRLLRDNILKVENEKKEASVQLTKIANEMATINTTVNEWKQKYDTLIEENKKTEEAVLDTVEKVHEAVTLERGKKRKLDMERKLDMDATNTALKKLEILAEIDNADDTEVFVGDEPNYKDESAQPLLKRPNTRFGGFYSSGKTKRRQKSRSTTSKRKTSNRRSKRIISKSSSRRSNKRSRSKPSSRRSRRSH